MTHVWEARATPAIYIVSAVLFIVGLKQMGRVRSAGRGSYLLAVGYILALLGVSIEAARLPGKPALAGVLIGAMVGVLASRGKPGTRPLLACTGGVAAALVAIAAFLSDASWPLTSGLALTGGARGAALGLAALAGGVALVLGVLAAQGPASRGAGQPAAVALTASASGLATAMVGYALGNPIVVTVGGLAAAAGFALAVLVANALGRKPLDVVFGTGHGSGDRDDYANVKACGAEEAAMVLETARNVILVPGYGMAVAQAQHALAELAKLLARRGAEVRFAIHPAAGLIPGHMNILLDEAKVPATQILECETANHELAEADVVLVVGANDVVNPAARDDRRSPLFGMPIVEAGRAAAVLVIKRSLRPGAAGVSNALFEQPNTTMVFGDAKRIVQAIGIELKAQTKVAA